ncbi:MAG TPA: XRE family transcriptional regulator [Bacteroides sp.]|nr:XRE family transcriptional regulator [Bacteroides sp.]
MKDRLIQLLDLEQLTPSKFADLIGVQRSSISHVLSGRNNPSFDFLQKTLRSFPGLNAEWLMLGKGKMYEHMGQTGPATLFDSAPSAKETDNRFEAEAGAEDRQEREDRFLQGGKKEVEEQVQQPAGDQASEIQGNQTAKRIVKVMILYDDDTFRSFEPSL